MTKERREIEIAVTMLRKSVCPFDGKHFSSMARAACEVCNPPRDAPTVERATHD